MSFAANCFRRIEVKCIKKTIALLHEFDDNVAVVVTTVASITTRIVQFQTKRPRRLFVQVGVSLRAGGTCPWRQRWQWAWLRCQQGSSNFHLTASLKRPRALRTPQREQRERYGTFALRNAWIV